MHKTPWEPRPRILVADDDRDAADVYCLLLSSVGYRVQRAYDGLTALSLAKVAKPDGALLNFMMPGMTGLDVLRELRAAGSTTKIIITSGTTAINELVYRSMQAGADACLRQPCPTDRLLRIVAEVMGQSRGLRADAGA
jgi:DNA-binding response OmpR family regulator